MRKIRTYTELMQFETFEERFDYLKLGGSVGEATFGYERWANQNFYTSKQWRDLRYEIIARDEAQDLGMTDYAIHNRLIVHHMNPMTSEDLERENRDVLNPEYLICVSHNTHNAIHYGDKNLLPQPLVERRPGDTRLWAAR